MSDMGSVDLLIDEELYRLEPAVRPDREEDLELSAAGGSPSVTINVWGKLILEGALRYELCIKHGLPFSVKQISCADRRDAISWACIENLKKSGLTSEMRIYLIGKRYLAEKRERGVPRQPPSVVRKSDTKGRASVDLPRYRTGTLIGKDYGIGFGTVLNYSTYAQAIDKIASADPALADAILSRELLLSQNMVIKLSQLPENELASVKENPARFFSSVPSKKRGRGRPPIHEKNIVPDDHTSVNIKQMPTYDPDSCIAGLTLTIPSWVSSIDRVKDTADFSIISGNATDGLKRQLTRLMDTANELLNHMQEESR